MSAEFRELGIPTLQSEGRLYLIILRPHRGWLKQHSSSPLSSICVVNSILHVSLQHTEEDLPSSSSFSPAPFMVVSKSRYHPLVLARLAGTFGDPDIHFKGLNIPGFYVAQSQCFETGVVGYEQESRGCSRVSKARKRIFLCLTRVCICGE